MIAYSSNEIQNQYFNIYYVTNKKKFEFTESENHKGYFSDIVIRNLNGRYHDTTLVVIKTETLKLFNENFLEKQFRICTYEPEYKIGDCIYDEIALKDEITNYEKKYVCNTIEQIKNKIGKNSFNFKTPYNNKAAKNYLIDFVELNGILHKIFININTWKFIQENSSINTLRLEISNYECFDFKATQKNHSELIKLDSSYKNICMPDIYKTEYIIEILLWDEQSKSDKEYDADQKEAWDSMAKESQKNHQAMIDDMNGDWGGLYGDEAELGYWNCD